MCGGTHLLSFEFVLTVFVSLRCNGLYFQFGEMVHKRLHYHYLFS